MSSEPKSQSLSLFSMARTKLQSAVGGGVKDTCSLHRWVLIKNSITHSHPPAPVMTTSSKADDVPYVYRSDQDAASEPEQVAYMFPDPDALSPREPGACETENEWLDCLLESLGGDDDYLDAEEGETGVSDSVYRAEDDDEPLSPLYSPMSSSDDLPEHSSYFINPHAIPLPYPIPYPPLEPSHLTTWLGLESSADSLHDDGPSLYHDPLPYYNVDDTEDLPVPDAIEDTSDDESDALSTPFDQSTSSLFPNIDPASVPLPPEQRRRSRPLQPQVYIDTDDSYFYPFELDPLPPHDSALDTAQVYSPSLYQEC